MRRTITGAVILLGPFALVFQLLAGAMATPTASFPFNNQLPPVARYGQDYSYKFSTDTYSSSEKIYYSAPDLPSWLKFDASSTTLSGVPPQEDAGNGDQTVNFTLQASDSTGTLSSPCVLQITSQAAPSWKSDDALTQVLSSAGKLGDSNSIVLSPGSQFQITFPDDFFDTDGENVVGHYAVTSDHQPLPIWLNFDGQQGKYWGTTPSVNSEIAPAESFGVLYIVSTIQGFTSASAEFNIRIGAHSLTTNMTTVSSNVTVGESFEYAIPIDSIFLDNKPLTAANVTNIEPSLPGNANWLKFDSKNGGRLSGKPPSTAANQSYPVHVQVYDNYNDSVTFDISIDVLDKKNTTVFTASSLPPANITRGQFFTYPIGKYLLNKKNVDISVDTNNNDWLSYNSKNFTLMGMVPRSFESAVIDLQAKVDDSEAQGLSAKLMLTGRSAARKTTSHSSSASSTRTTSTATSSSSASANPTSVPAKHKKKSSSNAVAIGCGVGIPAALIALAALLLVIWMRRRTKQREQEFDEEMQGNSPGSRDISAPMAVNSGMAPVFLAKSPSSSETTVEGEDEKKELGSDENGPRRQSTFNFMRMEAPDADQHTLTSLNPADRRSKSSLGSSAYSDVEEMDNDVVANIPRASWRHTNLSQRRWQDKRVSYNSLASIESQDPPTVRLANAEFPRELPHDPSSGIVHRMGSHSSSLAQHGEEDTPRPDKSQDEFPITRANDELYATASSGSGESDSSSLKIRPYRNSQGEFRWNETLGEGSSRVQTGTVDRKPSQMGHDVPDGEKGELAFV